MKGTQLLGKDRARFNLARLKVGREKFELVINPENAIDYRNGKNIDLREVLLSEKVFSDAQKGLAASEHLMQQVFKTSDALEAAKQILRRGEIQLTAEYREKLRQEKRKRIIDIIHRNSIDPKTNLPHPPQRIENALGEAKVKIDEHKKAEDQVQEIVKKLRPVLPIKFEVREVAVKVDPQFAAKSYATLKNFGRIVKDEWQNDGSLVAVVELPAGLQQDFFDELNKLTHGNCETKVLSSK
jgi:ribosome maturation protein SDO1